MLGNFPLGGAPLASAGTSGYTLSIGATEAKDTASVAVTSVTNVSFSKTEALDTASASLTSVTSVNLSTTEASDTASVAASAQWGISLSSTEATDTATFLIGGGGKLISLAATEQPDILAAYVIDYNNDPSFFLLFR